MASLVIAEHAGGALAPATLATITAATKGNIINVSRQMIVNDDMAAFSRLLSMLGRAAITPVLTSPAMAVVATAAKRS